HKAAENLTWTDFNEYLYAFRYQQAHSLIPLYRSCNLTNQSIAAGNGIGHKLRINIASDRHVRILKAQGMQVSSQAVLRWFHQRTMKRCADGQERGAFRATLISKFGGPLHRRGVTGNDNLFRRIDICRPTDLALRVLSLLESLLRNWISFSQFPAHTDGLRALAREQKGSGETTRRRSCHIARFVLGAYGRRSSRPVQPRQPFFNGVIDASFSEL